MAKNVEMMTQNIATAEELEVQSNEMSINAQQFKKQAIVLRKTYWWKNFKIDTSSALVTYYYFFNISIVFNWWNSYISCN
ncbi:hypothetical protein ENUP19_0358G0016 [Entamoeba nuttalli]|uniref:V-SNARE coiled-coil homology domain-containing protein n=1 Tax=Entamoeba nuttalli TaxID=412467 RepID=A0ABQ0DY58_9EUKA